MILLDTSVLINLFNVSKKWVKKFASCTSRSLCREEKLKREFEEKEKNKEFKKYLDGIEYITYEELSTTEFVEFMQLMDEIKKDDNALRSLQLGNKTKFSLEDLRNEVKALSNEDIYLLTWARFLFEKQKKDTIVATDDNRILEFCENRYGIDYICSFRVVKEIKACDFDRAKEICYKKKIPVYESRIRKNRVAL